MYNYGLQETELMGRNNDSALTKCDLKGTLSL